jgi:D-sorbitol dehydrogenase (acceptor)
MAEAVSFSFSKMSDDDLHAIARYLKTVPAANDSGAVAPSYAVTGALPAKLGDLDAAIDRSPAAMIDGSSTDGQRIYMGACATCHQMNGTGTQDQFYPPDQQHGDGRHDARQSGHGNPGGRPS